MHSITRAVGTVFTAAALAIVIAPAAGAATTAPAAGAATTAPANAADDGYWESIAVNSQSVEFTATDSDKLVARQSALDACAQSSRTASPDSCHMLHNYFHGDDDSDDGWYGHHHHKGGGWKGGGKPGGGGGFKGVSPIEKPMPGPKLSHPKF